jgi:hypothetical protein
VVKLTGLTGVIHPSRLELKSREQKIVDGFVKSVFYPVIITALMLLIDIVQSRKKCDIVKGHRNAENSHDLLQRS